MARRQVSIFINGREVANQMKTIAGEKRKVVRELSRMNVGSKEYNEKMEELDKLNAIIIKHRNRIRGVESSWNKLSKGAGKFLAVSGIAFGVGEIVQYGAELFELAAKMEVLQKKAQTVFGDALPAVTAAANENATAMGLTTGQYISQAAAIGDLLIPMGFQRDRAAEISTGLVDLSGALSEWTGGQISATEVSDILAKAMLGEREQLKSLGISIQEADVKARLAEKGLQGLTGELLQQAKATATLELITEKSTDAQTAFIDNAGTMVRRKAELSAKITEVSEKLATALIPVFEGLVSVAEGVAEGINLITDAIDGMIDPAGKAKETFEQQREAVIGLEKDLAPLLTRYDELKEQAGDSEEKQAELKQVISDIAKIVPTAVTEFDEYGNALDISTSKAQQFIEAQRLLLQQRNKEAIDENTEALDNYQYRVEKLNEALATRNEDGDIIKVITTMRKTAGEFEPVREEIVLTNDEIRAMQTELAGLETQINTTDNAIKLLKGFNIEDPAAQPDLDEPTSPSANLSPTEDEILAQAARAEELRKEREKQAQRMAKDLEKREKRLSEIIKKFQQDRTLSTLSAEDKKAEQLRLKYQVQIDEAAALEKAGIEGATEQKLELMRLQEQALGELRTEQARTKLEEDLAFAEEAELEKNLQQLEFQEAKKAAQELLNEEVREELLSERELELLELEEHLQSLQAMAEQYGLDTLGVEVAYRKKKDKIIKEHDQKEKKDLLKQQGEQAKALADTFGAYATIAKGAMDLVAAAGLEHTALGKIIALSTIAFKSAEAIANATASASSLPYPANLVAIASAVGTVLSNIAQAKKIIDSSPTPQKKKGGYHTVTGADDGITYRANYIGRPQSGMLPPTPSLVLASEAGPEYFVANQDLQNPVVANYVRMIENIRLGRTRQFVEGGATEQLPEPTESNDNALSTVALELSSTLQQLVGLLENGIQANIPDDNLLDIQGRLTDLNEAAGN